MITGLGTVNLFVDDQERARLFYTEKLGFEVRNDATLDGFRWLTVAPKGQRNVEFLLAVPQPPMFSPEDAANLRSVLAKGAMPGGVLLTDDCHRDFEALKAKGVTFIQDPADRPYGIEALLRDDSGNWFSLTQPFDTRRTQTQTNGAEASGWSAEDVKQWQASQK
jgi:catechol 2,3-dioxygenase-like lactoylglutathione lyase family enzyme